jgi:hypothetical protein
MADTKESATPPPGPTTPTFSPPGSVMVRVIRGLQPPPFPKGTEQELAAAAAAAIARAGSAVGDDEITENIRSPPLLLGVDLIVTDPNPQD